MLDLNIFPPFMDDIKLPHEGKEDDDDRFFIRSVEGEDLGLDDSSLGSAKEAPKPSVKPPVEIEMSASKKVAISFAKFVQLVANHSYIDIVDKNAEQEVIISGDLLTDLANAHDRARERRMPLMFVAGLVIGIILTYIILQP